MNLEQQNLQDNNVWQKYLTQTCRIVVCGRINNDTRENQRTEVAVYSMFLFVSLQDVLRQAIVKNIGLLVTP